MNKCKKCGRVSPLEHGTPEGWGNGFCLDCRLENIEILNGTKEND